MNKGLPLLIALVAMWIASANPVNAAAYGQVNIHLQEKFKPSGCANYERKTEEGSVLVLNDNATWAIYDLQTSYGSLNAGSYTGSYKSRKFYLTADDFREAFGLSLNRVTNKACNFSDFVADKIKPLKYSLKLNKRGNSVKISSKGKYSGVDTDTDKKKSGRWSISGKGSYKNKQTSTASSNQQTNTDVIGDIQTDPKIYALSLGGLTESPDSSDNSDGSGGFVAFTSNGFFLFISF
jgi:hypothetical protein